MSERARGSVYALEVTTERNMIMKKKIFVCALIAVCLSVVAYGTVAYFTYEETATNVVTAGNVRIELIELTINAEGGTEPFAGPYDIVPGAAVSKIVAIKNVGFADAWVRISVTKTVELIDPTLTETDLSLIGFEINEEYWTEMDGYYYYNTALGAGETTKPLFTEVTFSPRMGNAYQNGRATIDVIAYATQKVHNGNTVFEAAGWPEIN